MKQINVELSHSSYPIFVGEELTFDSRFFNERIRPHLLGTKVCVITNALVNGLYGEAVKSLFSDFDVFVFEMDDGEESKTLDTYSLIMNFLLENQFDRSLNLVALGGGVVGDVCGFVAATYQRGINLIQIPTTLLAQVDSSVGGKTAVNHLRGKNMIGAFYHPSLVLINTEMLSTLPSREYLAGLAEVVKYGLIYDKSFFAWLDSHSHDLKVNHNDFLSEAIARCCEIKSKIVSMDERESGIRAILNFGHTFGHAIENVSGYGVWLHGEAVAMGMVIACNLSVRVGTLNEEVSKRIQKVLLDLGLFFRPKNLNKSSIEALVDAMLLDKKVLDGRLKFILIEDIGEAKIQSGVDVGVVRDILNDYLAE